jgi:hypothetical protein
MHCLSQPTRCDTFIHANLSEDSLPSGVSRHAIAFRLGGLGFAFRAAEPPEYKVNHGPVPKDTKICYPL